MSPTSTDWSRSLGWAGRSQPFDAPERLAMPYSERPNSPLQGRKNWVQPGRRGQPGSAIPLSEVTAV